MADHSWPVIGHDWAVDHLDRAIRHGRVRHAYLITGPSRIGKTTLARVFAAALNCTGPNPPCGVCRACTLTLKGSHPDVTVVESAHEGGTLKIDQVRGLQQVLALRPYEGRYRVAILRRFHEAHPAAEDALLKTLEEPPPSVVIILTTESADRLLPTIVSRCQPIHLRPVALQTVRAALEQHWGAPPEQADTLARLSAGRIGWAAAAYQDASELDRRNQALDVLETALSGTRRERFALVEDLASDKAALLDTLEVWTGYWRDVVLLATGSRVPLTNANRAETLAALARQAGPDAAQRALHATRRTIDYLVKNANTRLALEVLMLDYPASQ